jgi:hypothetical protein
MTHVSVIRHSWHVDIRDVVRAFLRTSDAYDAAVAEEENRLVATGHRLVSMENVGNGRVQIIDISTATVLFSGPMQDALDRWHETWADVDRITHNVDITSFDTPIIDTQWPESLLDALRTWTENHENDAREFVGDVPSSS